MNLGLLPDLVAMAVLIAILLALRGRHPKRSADLWLLGLLFIFLEDLARLFYITNQHNWLHRLTHIVALDAYVLAGVIFSYSAGREVFSRWNRIFYLGVNALPLIGLLTVYGADLKDRGLFLGCALAGLVIGVVSSIALRRGWSLVLTHAAGWLIITWLVAHDDRHQAVYFGLFCLYLLAAITFQQSLPGKRTGRLAIFTGFIVWAICFLVHPLVITHHVLQDINDQVWSMQKFLISIGMLIVMLEEQIDSNEWLALHDQLTGLPNRRLFDDRLAQALNRSQRLRTSVALIMIDLDGFKSINDSYGHAAGDELLRGISANLARVVRASDTLARIGGDEFVVVAGDITGHSVPRLVEAIEGALRKPVLLHGSPVSITGSLGVALAPDDAGTAAQLLQAADRRMYRLKHQRGTKPSSALGARVSGSQS